MESTKKGNVIDAFLEGARNGWKVGINSMLPNVVFAFALIRILDLTGLLDLIGLIFSPVMMLVGLPGAAATVLMASLMSMGGGAGVAASLVAAGALEPGSQVATVLPAIFLMGSLVQFVGRVNGTVEIPQKYNVHMVIAAIVSAFLCMFVMNLIT